MVQEVKNKIESSSALEVTEKTFEKIEETKGLNAYISLCKEKALAQAKAADERRKSGKSLSVLDGIPIAVKDNIYIEGVRTTCASKVLENFISPYTATAVAKLEAAGAVVVGKTNMDEFAMGASGENSFFGKVVNPAAPDRISGGSSSGSAATVAAGVVALALGSDTGGSIRQPAACTGTVGIKPTHGRVSNHGVVAYAKSMDQVGAISNSVKDLVPVLDLMCEPATNFGEHLGKGVKGKIIGLPKEYFIAKGLEPRYKDVVENALHKLEREGAVLKEVSLPHIQYAMPSYCTLVNAEATQSLSEICDMYKNEDFGIEVKLRLMLGTYALSSSYFKDYYALAQKARHLITEDFKKVLSECDAIASPAMPGLPQLRGKCEEDHLSMVLSDMYTSGVNLAGLPGLVQPCGKIDGVPVGIQWIGKSFDESSLLCIGDAAERIF
ncbi:MAG: aspartyl/glutamyl-tRNA amidotransferase subunit A [Fibromonadaceae bacterium]|jgi:aspartyl-tRNA(Asn)/glutamyl-tRNA(Gln) amidotransferase subunit A|nr:aspartyl/glutamyl-tRNA amidotransferase subunit A [Fibromonadaceae bacterium]